MTFTYRVEPIGPTWPDRTPDGRRQISRFTARWTDTLDLLGRELTQLGAKNVVLQLDVTDRHIRNDGGLRADARIDFPGVRISFDSKHGPLTYGTDAFSHGSTWRQGRGYERIPGWQCNARAIALGLEALRKVDRYGIGRSGEQYQGWKQLPTGTGSAPAGLTRDEALDLIARIDYDDSADRHVYDDLPAELLPRRRALRAKAHPDRHGGDRTLWDRVEAACDLVGIT